MQADPDGQGDDAEKQDEEPPQEEPKDADQVEDDEETGEVEVVLSPTFKEMVEGAETIEHVTALERAGKVLRNMEATMAAYD